MSENPLFHLRHRHGPLPFADFRAADVPPALDAALAEARENLRRLENNPEPPTMENTVDALEAADEWADRVASIYFHLLDADGGPELQELGKVIPPKLAAFRNDVSLNPRLFARIGDLYARRESLGLRPEPATVLENHYLAFARNGACLSETDQAILRDLDQRMSVCAPAFSENVRKATQAYVRWVSDEAEVASLPAQALAAAKAAARDAGRPGEWKFTLDAPSYMAVMTHADNASLRQDLWTAYNQRCVDGEFSNAALIREILDLRERRARLLGYGNHADYVLERRMARDLPTVRAFYERMLPVVMPAACRDIGAVRALKAEETGDRGFFPWDYAYYAERLKRRSFDLDEEALRPYFEFESTLKALFALLRELFQVGFEPVAELPVYRPDVRVFRVRDEAADKELGILYVDPFPRPTKRPGAWMGDLLGQGRWGGEIRRPHVAIVCNFTPPVDGGPSLLTFDEAHTLFHEFGHALHGLFSQCAYRSVAGVNVFWDFVELPSQLLENWLADPGFLRRFARHHLTGEAMPEELIGRIQASRAFQKGYQAVRQLGFGLLDLAWHTTPTDALGPDLMDFERKALEPVRLFDPQPGCAASFSFQHIFSGGYAAGYYSYKWAEVLEADVFALFQERGVFDAETAGKLRRQILERGGSEHPMELFKAFRGREPDPDALLRRDGLLDPA